MNITMTRCNDHKVLAQEVNTDLLKGYWSLLECSGPDLFTFYKYNGSKKREIQHGWIPKNNKKDIGELQQCVEDLDMLNSFIDNYSKKAQEEISNGFDLYETRRLDTNCYCIYCRCTDGIIGVGWSFRERNLNKARLMAIFTLYLYGLLNSSSDPELWKIVEAFEAYVCTRPGSYA